MKRLVVDIETDSLDATTIYCIVAKDIDEDRIYTYKPAHVHHAKNLIESADIVIMHNGVSFDAPVLKRLLGVEIPLAKIRDTLIMSQLASPVRDGGHSLDAWGKTLGFGKIDFHDFSGYTDEMLKYCIRDVDLTAKVYKALVPTLKGFSARSIKLEHQIRAVVDKQEQNGFTLDVKEAMLLVAKLSDESHKLREELHEVFKPITEIRVSEKTGKRLKDKVTVFNPGSRQQIAQRLISLGWKPKKFTEKGQPIVGEEILEKIDIPQAQLIATYLTLEKRVSQIKSWVAVADENDKVHGRVMTLGTITGRMSHSSPNMAQVPAVYSPYGKECRALWTVSSDDYTLLGTDASGLELRMLAHYMNDEAYTKEVVEGDVHTANQTAAGLPTRDNAKTFIYAFLYGAGAGKIGQVVNGTAKDGQRLIDNFLNNMPALKALRSKVDKLSGRGYLIGLDGRVLTIRNKHAALNLLLQGAGAIVCKEWLKFIIILATKAKLDFNLVASVHDEYQFEVRKGQEEAFGAITKEAMKLTEESLNVNCPLDCEYKTGINWKDTH
jgi:DNA polymerase-1